MGDKALPPQDQETHETFVAKDSILLKSMVFQPNLLFKVTAATGRRGYWSPAGDGRKGKDFRNLILAKLISWKHSGPLLKRSHSSPPAALWNLRFCARDEKTSPFQSDLHRCYGTLSTSQELRHVDRREQLRAMSIRAFVQHFAAARHSPKPLVVAANCAKVLGLLGGQNGPKITVVYTMEP